jgi:hypothetical protein
MGFDGANPRVRARARSAAGALSPIQTLSAPGQNALFPQVAVADGGDAAFVWQRFDGSSFRAQTRVRSAAGALTATQTLSAAGQNADVPRVGVDADGDAVFAWQRFDGTSTRVQARARSAGGALSPVQTLSAAGQIAVQPQIGVDADGDAVVAWLQDGPTDLIHARQRAADGALFATQILSDTDTNSAFPALGVAADGDVVTAWERSDGANNRIEGASGP